MKLVWINDPKTSKQSVSLTVFIVATVMYVGTITANIFGYDVDPSLIQNFWIGSASLYCGRRLKFSKDGDVESSGKRK